MNVSQMIKRLKELPQDFEVYIDVVKKGKKGVDLEGVNGIGLSTKCVCIIPDGFNRTNEAYPN
jgi:hypothetical protein